jgi:hypothetical protein
MQVLIHMEDPLDIPQKERDGGQAVTRRQRFVLRRE